MKIEITPDDIEKGVRGWTTACPIARAVKRATGAKTVFANRRGIEAVGAPVDALNRKWVLPSKLIPFMEAFDRGEPVQPLSFNLP